MRHKHGLGTGLALGAMAQSNPVTGIPGLLGPALFFNEQTFFPDAVLSTELNGTTFFENEQTFFSGGRVDPAGAGLDEGNLLNSAVAPINQGLVFAAGSAPALSGLLGTDLVSGNAGTPLTAGAFDGTNQSEGTWLCLDSTSLTEGGASWPNTSQLRTITNKFTIIWHGVVDSFGTWSHLVGIPYADGTWVLPWLSLGFRRRSNAGEDLNVHWATSGGSYVSYNSVGGFATGEHQFAVRVDGPAGVARFWVDGVQQGPDVAVTSDPVDWGAQQPVTVMNRSSSAQDEGVDGQCYSLLIWNKLLTNAEVLSAFRNPQQFYVTGPRELTGEFFENEQTFFQGGIVSDGSADTILGPQRFDNAQTFFSGGVVAPQSSPGTVGPLEPVDGTALQVAINVATSPRQTWIGYGWGANSGIGGAQSPATLSLARAQQFPTKLCEDINARVLRIFTPSNTGFISVYKPVWDFVKNRGFTTILATDFVHRTDPDPSMATVAAGILAYKNQGVPITHYSIQNEPDGGPAPEPSFTLLQSVPPGFGLGEVQINGSNAAAVEARYRDLRIQLDNRGLQSVKILSYEWRHPTAQGPSEFDHMNSAGLYDQGIIEGFVGHIYDTGFDPTLYEQRYATKGLELYSSETGNNGSPNCQARFLAGCNHGSAFEIMHYHTIHTSTISGDQGGQSLVDFFGNPRPWYGAIRVLSNNLQPGSRFRRCTSSDRPSGLNASHADGMIRRPRDSGGRNPRQQIVAARRTDGRWQVCGVNTTHGSDSFNTNTSGHYGGVKQQFTVTINELTGADRLFQGSRASITGAITGGVNVNCKNGQLRFTLQPGESIGLTSTV